MTPRQALHIGISLMDLFIQKNPAGGMTAQIAEAKEELERMRKLADKGTPFTVEEKTT